MSSDIVICTFFSYLWCEQKRHEHMKQKTALLIIDMQTDFVSPSGALPVKGASNDCANLANFILGNASAIDTVILTMDSHYPSHIAHPVFWRDKEGNHPRPFTEITPDAYENGEWRPVDDALGHVEKYMGLMRLRSSSLTIWPPHCVIGTQGWNIDPLVIDVVKWWSETTGRAYDIVQKGSCPWSEHYSCFSAFRPVEGYPDTEFNNKLLYKLDEHDSVLVAGEALSHCVAESLKDMLFNNPKLIAKTTLLTDCSSPIGDDFSLDFDPAYCMLRDCGMDSETSKLRL